MISGRSSRGSPANQRPATSACSTPSADSGTSTSRSWMSISCAPASSAASRATLPWLWPCRTNHSRSGQFCRICILLAPFKASVGTLCRKAHWSGGQGSNFHVRALVASMSRTFASFFQAGFECSSHRRRDGVRLDLIKATAHDKHALRDYRLCKSHGFDTIRDGLRWHLIGKSAGKYDWSSWLPMLEAAEEAGIQVIWDLFHYGSPDCIDQAGDDFPERFTDFAIAALEVQQSVSNRTPLICPLNEINFLSWAVDDGYFPHVGPVEQGWFKHQLVKTAISASRAIKRRWPKSTIIWAEPLIHVAPHNQRRQTVRAAV